MSAEEQSPIGPRCQSARKLLKLWCWFTFAMIVIGYVRLGIADSGPGGPSSPMSGFWWLLFGGYALMKGGLLDQPGGYRKGAWAFVALTALSAFAVVHGLGLFRAIETSLIRGAAVEPIWLLVARIVLLVFTGWVTLLLFRAAGEAKDPSPFETWPPCRPERRRTASIAALVVAAAFIVVAVLGLTGVISADSAEPGVWVVFGVFYGGATLLAGIQMWFGRWVAITVGVLVPVCMIMALTFGTVGLAGFIPPGIAIPGAIGAVVCTVFLIRGVTCRPAM